MAVRRHARQGPARPGPSVLAIAFFVAALALQAVTWWRAAHWYPLLPDPFPTRFDGAGVPSGWSAKGVAAWFSLPAIGLFMLCLLAAIGAGLSWMALHAPGLLNVPRKDRFLALPPQSRVVVLGPTRTYLAWTVMLVCGLFLCLVEGTGLVATGAMAVLPIWPVVGMIVLVLVGLVPYWRSTVRAMDAAGG